MSIYGRYAKLSRGLAATEITTRKCQLLEHRWPFYYGGLNLESLGSYFDKSGLVFRDILGKSSFLL